MCTDLDVFLSLTSPYQPCVFLRRRVNGCISGKSAVDKHQSLLDQITAGTMRGSHCTSVQVSIAEPLRRIKKQQKNLLVIEVKKKGIVDQHFYFLVT